MFYKINCNPSDLEFVKNRLKKLKSISENSNVGKKRKERLTGRYNLTDEENLFLETIEQYEHQQNQQQDNQKEDQSNTDNE